MNRDAYDIRFHTTPKKKRGRRAPPNLCTTLFVEGAMTALRSDGLFNRQGFQASNRNRRSAVEQTFKPAHCTCGTPGTRSAEAGNIQFPFREQLPGHLRPESEK